MAPLQSSRKDKRMEQEFMRKIIIDKERGRVISENDAHLGI